MCLCRILVLLCTCFAMSTKMAAKCILTNTQSFLFHFARFATHYIYYYLILKKCTLYTLFILITGRNSGLSFIFSLANNDNLPPFKSTLRKRQTCTVQNSGYGAIFGSGSVHDGRDVSISNNADRNGESFSDFGHSYTLPEGYVSGSTKARSLLAGSFRFTPTEVEVFY